jgi:hypothetical protein
MSGRRETPVGLRRMACDAMRVVMEYRQHAKQCRDLAARTPNPANKKKLKHEAETWAKMAALRERNLTDKDAATDGGSLRPPQKLRHDHAERMLCWSDHSERIL